MAREDLTQCVLDEGSGEHYPVLIPQRKTRFQDGFKPKSVLWAVGFWVLKDDVGKLCYTFPLCLPASPPFFWGGGSDLQHLHSPTRD